MQLTFLGAAGQVTGSRYLLEAAGLKILIDCGLFQERDFLARNWESSPVPVGDIDHVLLTHAHLDHCGLVPRLVAQGYRGPVLATRASVDLAGIVLRDSGRLQEEDAAFKRRRHQREGRQGRFPEVPLYTEREAETALAQFRGVRYDEPVALSDQVTAWFRDAGHILGSAIVELHVREDDRSRRIVFSGDIGQWDRPLVRDPSLVADADYVIVESTYGGRRHADEGPPDDALCEIVNDTEARGGNLLIPTFAIERAQEVLYYLSKLVWQDRIPHLLVFLDSPMAVNATEVFLRYSECLDEETQGLLRSSRPPFAFPGLRLVRTVEESKAINRIRGTCVIMAGSGMCTGGRIKHHLEHQIGRLQTTVLFVGYQAQGTLGRQIVDGASEVRIHGQLHPVRARIAQIHGLSAHADQEDLRRWMHGFARPPRGIFVTHGEPASSQALAALLAAQPGQRVTIPAYQQTVVLD